MMPFTLQRSASTRLLSPVLASIVMGVVLFSHVPQRADAQTDRPVASQTEKTDGPAVLLADSISFDGERLIASGAVEVLYEGARLTASRLIYDQITGGLAIEGPIRLTDADANAIIYASAAELDNDLRNGILTSARFVIDQQLQLSAARMDRIDGRYTRLNKTVSSACRICDSNPVPLWQIRAKEVVHDSVERQLYFKDAQFRLGNIPVFYLPRLRLPDPTLDRATGFLVPELRTNTTLGTGIEIPYFFKMGDDKDLTLSPYLSTGTRTLGVRFRRAYVHGDLEINGAVSDDDLADGLRGYLFAEGTWDIGRGLNLSADLRMTSDISYLLDYDLYRLDRLPSEINLSRYSRGEAIDVSLRHIRTLRESEVQIEDTLPFLLGEAVYERRFTPSMIGGTAWVGLSAAGHYRRSEVDQDGTDVARLSAQAGWQNSYIFGPGLRLDSEAALSLDSYSIGQNTLYDDSVARATPAASLKLSYPLQRSMPNGAMQILEPIVQVAWSQTYGGEVPNTDSLLTEFDEGNLLALSKYSGVDPREDGYRGALGLRFSRYGAKADYGFTVGRVFSENTASDFTAASGLSGLQSDFLIGAHLSMPGPVSMSTRALLDPEFQPVKFETRLDMVQDRYALGLVHSFVIEDPEENRDTELSEVALDGSVRLGRNWTASADYRYDFEQDVSSFAGVGLEYQNECARLRFDVSRRFTETTSLEPTTNFSLTVGFGAFGAPDNATDGTAVAQCGI